MVWGGGLLSVFHVATLDALLPLPHEPVKDESAVGRSLLQAHLLQSDLFGQFLAVPQLDVGAVGGVQRIATASQAVSKMSVFNRSNWASKAFNIGEEVVGELQLSR